MNQTGPENSAKHSAYFEKIYLKWESEKLFKSPPETLEGKRTG